MAGKQNEKVDLCKPSFKVSELSELKHLGYHKEYKVHETPQAFREAYVFFSVDFVKDGMDVTPSGQHYWNVASNK